MKLDSIKKTGTTQGRKQFWDDARKAVISSQKIAGRHVTVTEHPGKGTFINVDDTSARRPGGTGTPTGACCIAPDTCVTVTEARCAELGGVYRGNGTNCHPNPCACPVDHTLCVTFADILPCVSCINITTGSFYLEVSAGDIDLNGSFELTEVFAGQWEGEGGTLHLKKFTNDLCTTMTDECDTVPFQIVLQCFGSSEPEPNTMTYNVIYELPSSDVCLAGWPGFRLEAFIGQYDGPLVLPSTGNLNQIATHCGNSGTGISIIQLFGDPDNPPTATMDLVAGSCAP